MLLLRCYRSVEDAKLSVALALENFTASAGHLVEERVDELLAGLLGGQVVKLAQEGGLALGKALFKDCNLISELCLP